MARFLFAACAVFAALSLAGCGSSDMSGNSATGAGDGGSVGNPDAGTATDAGSVDAGNGGSQDAGGGGIVDAGTTDAGSGGGGTGGGSDGGGSGGADGGTATCSQAGFPEISARNYVVDPAGRDPFNSAADGSGTLLFGVTTGGFTINSAEAALVSSDGDTKAYLSFPRGARLHADPAGFSGIFGSFSGFFSVRHLDSDGKQAGGEVSYQLAFDARFAATIIPDPRSGSLILGKFGRSGVPGFVPSFRAAFVTAAPAELWNTPLASVGEIFGGGLDLSGNAIVITDGSARWGAGAISAQWISASGVDLTGEFLLIAGFQPASSTWFEVSQLGGGGVAIRRVDATDFTGSDVSSRYLCAIGAGATNCAVPPDWLSSRPNVRVEPVRSGTAYAVLPDPAAVSDCKQTVEVLDANGASCGSMELRMAQGSCHTRPLAVGKDGTLIQPLADEAWSCGPGDRPCRATWRWWPGLFR